MITNSWLVMSGKSKALVEADDSRTMDNGRVVLIRDGKPVAFVPARAIALRLTEEGLARVIKEFGVIGEGAKK